MNLPSKNRETNLITQSENLNPHLQELIQKYAKAENTLLAYKKDWIDFIQWCAKNKVHPMPADPEMVANYLEEMTRRTYTTKGGQERPYKLSTIERRLAAISQAHQIEQLQSPTSDYVVRTTMQAIRRKLTMSQTRKAPIEIEDIRSMIQLLPNNLKGVRDRALLLLGFSGAFRRSEIVSLNVEDIEFCRDGYYVYLRRSKTDNYGEGRKIAIPYGSSPVTCPVRAMDDWLLESKLTDGPLFPSITRHGKVQKRMTAQSVALIIKKLAEKLGLDPNKYSGHSLRAGFVTTADKQGVSEKSIMAQTGHKSSLVLRRYIRDNDLFRDNAASKIGL